MEPIRIVREVRLSPDEAFARVTRWESHGEHVPFTKVHRTEHGFVARTGLGPIGFDDVMDVARWDPPRFARLEKRGRVVLGWAEIEVEPIPMGARVTWTEVAHVRGVPRAFARLESFASEQLFGRLLTALLQP